MSSCITVYPCIIAPAWEVYPRVFYFRGRFIDLHKRFQRIIQAIPKVLHDERLLQYLIHLTESLERKTLSLIVIGRENLTADDIFVSPKSLEGTGGEVQDTFPTIAICNVTVAQLDQRGTQEIVLTMQHFNGVIQKDTVHQYDSLIVMCKTKTVFAEEDITLFRQDVFSAAPKPLRLLLGSIANIIISSNVEGLKHHISTMFETRIVEAFISIRSFLSTFALDSRLGHQTELELLKDRYVTKALQGFLRNGFGLSEFAFESCNKTLFLSQLIPKIANIVKCVVTVPMASKYTLSAGLCNQFLHEFQFEYVLMQSVSKKTHYLLTKLYKFAISSRSIIHNLKDGTLVLSSDVVKASKCTAYDFIWRHLQNDFKVATSQAEEMMSSMKKPRIIMRKVIFEINGYLKQTIVKHTNVQIAVSGRIPDIIRKDIMGLEGVYGMGTIYGVIEIHLDEDDKAQVSELTSRIKSLMREHNFHNPYHIKYLKH